MFTLNLFSGVVVSSFTQQSTKLKEEKQIMANPQFMTES